jgi:dUTP pyrophosphatase
MIAIQLQRLPHGKGLPLPSYATEGAAGLDVVAAEDVTLGAGQRHAVATGFAIAIPEGYEVQVRPRSGLALRHGITCLNAPGTIDHEGDPRQSRKRTVRGPARRADCAARARAGAEG